MKSLIKDFMTRNKVLVSYVRDTYGFRKGVVVALSPTVLGFSLVNKSEDVDWDRMKPWQLPAIQRMIAAKKEDGTPVYSTEEVLSSKPYRRCVNADHLVRIPLFERKEGLMRAIDSALNEEIKIVDGKITTAISVVGFENGQRVTESVLPKDRDLWDVIKIVAERASRAKW